MLLKMSSFLISDKTLNRILTFIGKKWNFYDNVKLKRQFWDDFGYKELSDKEKESLNNMSNDEETDFILNKIGFVFKEINTEAVNQRYNEKSKTKPFKFQYEECDIFQAYNHLRCLTYQMNEGNIPETETYKFLQEIENLLAVQIANETKEVKNAEWEAE